MADDLNGYNRTNTKSKINGSETIDWRALETVDDMPPPDTNTVNRSWKVCQTHTVQNIRHRCAKHAAWYTIQTIAGLWVARHVDCGYWNIHTGDDKGVLIINRFKMVQSEAFFHFRVVINTSWTTLLPLRLHVDGLESVSGRARAGQMSMCRRK